MQNGKICVPMGFLRKPRYALHGISSYYWRYGWRPLPRHPSSTSRMNEKPYHIPCRNDGWHHVSSTSTKTAGCKGICPSSHQGSQRTREIQQLDAPEAKQSSWGCSNSPSSMVPMTQTQPHNEQSEVTQGQVEPARRKVSLWNELFWDIHPRCDMVCHQAYDHLQNHVLLVPSTSGLCYGLSTSSNQDGHLYEAATRDSNQAWELQGTGF